MTPSLMITLRMSPDEVADLDRLRGEETRSSWLRGLLNGAAKARERQGAPTRLWVVNEAEHARL